MNALLALVYLERMAKNGVFGYDNELAIETAIEAVKKQIPKKPSVSTHKYIHNNTDKEGTYHLTHCPSCFHNLDIGYFESLIDKGTAFCHRCGQAIDWEEGGAKMDGDSE